MEKLKQTIDYCVQHNILREFLKSKEGEVQEMMMQVFTQEQAMNIALMEKYKIGLTEGIERGLEQGKKAEALLIAKNMKNKGFDYDLICTITGLTIHELESL